MLLHDNGVSRLEIRAVIHRLESFLHLRLRNHQLHNAVLAICLPVASLVLLDGTGSGGPDSTPTLPWDPLDADC